MLKLQEFKKNNQNYHCETCNDKRYIEKHDLNGLISYVRCECQKTIKILKTINESGLTGSFEELTFDNFTTKQEYQKIMYKKGINFLENALKNNDKENWFILSGQVGSGKTHICTAISGQLVLNGKSFFYLPYVSLMPKLAMDLKNFYLDVKEKAERLLENIKNVEVLYIDDFLKIKEREQFNLIWQIIDYRYQNKKLITIISTELYYDTGNSIKALDSAMASRIYERAKGGEYFVEVGQDNDKNYREKGKMI